MTEISAIVTILCFVAGCFCVRDTLRCRHAASEMAKAVDETVSFLDWVEREYLPALTADFVSQSVSRWEFTITDHELNCLCEFCDNAADHQIVSDGCTISLCKLHLSEWAEQSGVVLPDEFKQN